MDHLAGRPFRSLSGGEQQRTLLARALVAKPTVLMLDEPTAGMDVDAGRRILKLIAELAAAGGQTVLMISHMLDDIRTHTHQVIYVHRLKEFVRTGSPAEVLKESVEGPTFEDESRSV
jgi:ABC-2 type transport system ATP-binding protein